MDKIKTVFIVGPTASGKTSLGIEIAKRLNGEIVSADSMQIYKEMNIATAKPTESEKRDIKHYMIDFLSPSDSYSVAKYKEDALKCIKTISLSGKLPVVVGGTGLYVDTLIYNTEFFDIETDEELRNELYEKYEKLGAQKMWELLCEIDPVSSQIIHSNNKKKIIRALEVYYQTGKTLSEQTALSHNNGEILDCTIIGLNFRDRDKLYNRINTRVDKMISDGLVHEAEEFYSKYGGGTAVQAIGYKEIKPYLDGALTLNECVENLKKQTRRYAKRQLTWFRRNEKIKWLYVDEYNDNELVESAVKIIERGE